MIPFSADLFVVLPGSESEHFRRWFTTATSPETLLLRFCRRSSILKF
jgi:hypothetical protein